MRFSICSYLSNEMNDIFLSPARIPMDKGMHKILKQEILLDFQITDL